MILKKQHFLIAAVPLLVILGGLTTHSLVKGNSRSLVDPSANAQASTARAADTVNMAALAQVLETYVDDQGLVDYVSLQSDRQDLDAFNASLWLTEPAVFESWSQADQIAFLVNAYKLANAESNYR
jgi:hypothetical protein